MLYITQEAARLFYERLLCEGKDIQTVYKYQRDLYKLREFLNGKELTQESLEEYKAWLVDVKKYKIRSANSFLSCANHFCKLMGQENIHVSAYKLTRTEKESSAVCCLSTEEYEKLAEAAVKSNNWMIALVMQILSMTDIRVTELFWITVESLEKESVKVVRGSEPIEIKLPADIINDLKWYAACKEYKSGSIFRTNRGNPVDRVQLWRKLKGLCSLAGVDEKKVSFQSMKRPLGKKYYSVGI